MRAAQSGANSFGVWTKATVTFAVWLIFAGAQAASAATLCVNPTGKGGCFATITAVVTAAAVNDTIQVAKGTYDEDIVVGKSLSLIGANPKNTVIDATGLANGIFVDGVDNAGLSGVG